jgi:anaerobic magnesium-protoporphyrin IX monomethyl ester cyclase
MIQRIALISPLDCFDNYGLRSISAYLKRRGIETRMIFLPRYAEIWNIVFHQDTPRDYPRQLLDQIRDCASESDAVGITMMSSDKDRVKSLVQSLKTLGKPIVLGGVHPSSFPEDALDVADYVVVGEGYEPLYEWCHDPGKTDIPNLWVRHHNGRITRNDIRPALADIDSLPYPDYGPENHFIAEKGRLKPLTRKLIRKYMGRYYSVFTSHGCPFECSYCINSRYKHLGQGYDCFRYHSVEYVIGELKYALALSPDLQYVSIPDDGFIFHDEDYIDAFAEAYRREIRLPFAVMGIIPSYLTQKKLDCLVNAGMLRTRTGFQSASPATLRSYRRPGYVEKFRQCHDMLRCYPQLVFPYYDLIIDNPMVDTEKDMVDTIDFLLTLEGRFTLILYSLRMYCGTELYEKARKMKLDPWYYHSHYGNYSKGILTLAIMVIQATNSKVLARYLLGIYRRKGNVTCPDFLFKLLTLLWMARQGIEHVRKGDASTVPGFVARWLIRSKPRPKQSIGH